MVIFLLLGVPIALLSKVNQFIALQLLSCADYLTVFTTEQLQPLAFLFLRLHDRGGTIAGMLTFYLVVTALLTVRCLPQGFDWIGAGALLFALMVGFLSITFGIQGLTTGTVEGLAPMPNIVSACAT